MKEFEPELGQMLNGQPYHRYECPEYIIALLQYLEYEMENTYDEIDGNSPFRNTGNTFNNGVFKVESYSWNDEIPQLWNFKYLDIEISWYKWLGRGTTINKKFSTKKIIEMFDNCLESIR